MEPSRGRLPAWRVRSKRDLPSRFQQEEQIVSTAHDTIAECAELLRRGDLDGLVQFLPETVILYAGLFKGLSLRHVRIPFSDIVESLQQQTAAPFMDTFAVRNLAMSTPRSLELLSSVFVSPSKFLQRCRVTSTYGEESVLTFTLTQRDRLDFSSCYPSVGTSPWVITSIVGEAATSEVVCSPSPSTPPEAVVESSLQLLQECDFHTLYRLSSPTQRALMGSLERFISTLTCDVRYVPLLRHGSARSLRRFQFKPSLYLELVQVQGRVGDSGRGLSTPRVYCWTLSRQPEGSPFANCWMTDYIQHTDDARLLRALQ